MNILLCTDNNYVMPTGVLMHSISINNGKDIHYYILADEHLVPQSRDTLTQIAYKYKNEITFCIIDENLTKGFPVGREDQPQHITIAAYYRLFAAEVLPKNIDKVIYLDGDMIVRKCIKNLWNINLEGKALGVVHDVSEPKHCSCERLIYPSKYGYFNSGMLVINLKYWRDNKCFATFVDFIKNNGDKIIMHDQDVLNSVFYDSKVWVPITYNFQSGFIYRNNFQSHNHQLDDEISSSKNDPAIIHYVSSSKPWNINCFFGYRCAWRYYWRKSQWKKQKLIGDNSQTLKEHIRNFLLRHDLFFPDKYYEKIILRK